MGVDFSRYVTYNPEPTQRRYGGVYERFADIGSALGRAVRFSKDDELKDRELSREEQRDKRSQDREDTAQQMRAREIVMNDKRAGQREDLYRTQENRREEQAKFERDEKTRAEDEGLFRQLQNASTPWEADAAAQALERRGYVVHRPDANAAPPPMAPPTQPKPPMSAGDQKTSAELDAAGNRYLPGLTGMPAKRHLSRSETADLDKQLDDAGDSYLTKLNGRPSSFLPGQRPTSPSVTLSSQYLSPDDPYNNIR